MQPGTCIAATAEGITVACGDGGAVDVLQAENKGIVECLVSSLFIGLDRTGVAGRFCPGAFFLHVSTADNFSPDMVLPPEGIIIIVNQILH